VFGLLKASRLRILGLKNTAVAQWLEQGSYKAKVGGSIPPCRTYCIVAQLVEQAAVNRRVVGSSPTDTAFWPDS
jgi:hypothetical protein